MAWRRATLESDFDAGVAPAELAEDLSALRWYHHGLGDALGANDDFVALVYEVPFGEMDQSLFLEALYRIETATSIAWALHLTESIPSVDMPAEFEQLDILFPPNSGKGAFDRATLRHMDELRRTRDDWEKIVGEARARRDEAPREEMSMEYSRAYERFRGLIWTCDSTLARIEDAQVALD